MKGVFPLTDPALFSTRAFEPAGTAMRQIAGRTRPATEHMVREIGTDLACSVGLRNKKNSSRRGRFFSWLLPL
jgi:hypothetical protein